MSSSYYDEDEEVDIHIHRGRASPVYHEHRYAPPPPPPPMAVSRPVYYSHGPSYIDPGPPVRRPRAPSYRGSPERAAPAPAPVIINNQIYNYDDEEEEEDRRYHQLVPSHSHHRNHRQRSRSRSRSYASSPRSSREDYEKTYELEKTRKELEAFKLEAEREKEEKRIKKEMEFKKLRQEREAEEEKERIKHETEKAVQKFKLEEAEKAAKAKKEKEEREKEYQQRLRDDLRKRGMDEGQIEAFLKKDKDVSIAIKRPTYTRMSRKHLSIETLNIYNIEYQFDEDPGYVLIKRVVPEHEQDILWSHTREIRERRQPQPLVVIEGKKKHGDVEFEFVRKKKHHDRRHSPSPLVTFFAGGRPH